MIALEASRALARAWARACGGDAEPIETHASIVVLSRDRAFKFRKPVDLGFLDYRTLDARRRDCEEETRLNRRLAPEVYLGTYALLRDDAGSLLLASKPPVGAVILDWIVAMRRLPAEGMLDRLLAEDRVSGTAVETFARELAAFHESVGPADPHFGSVEDLARRIETNLRRLREHAVERTGILSTACADALERILPARLAAVAPTLERRRRAGRVREGHGDLHARNLCLVDGRIVAYDCLQFDRGLRTVDVASEVGFLAMDLAFRGHRELADAFVRAYADASGDAEVATLVPLFALHYAVIRAMVDAIRAGEPAIDDAERARLREEIRRHALLAAGYASGPALVLVAGLPLTGKSTLARAIAGPLRARILRSDEIRKELAGIAPNERGGAALYAAEASDRTYAEVGARAERELAAGRSVVVDAAALERARRDALRARGAQRPAFLVHATALRATIEARAALRRDDPTEVSDAGLAVHDALARTAEPPTEWPLSHRVEAGAERPIDEHLAALAERILVATVSAGAAPAGDAPA